MGGGAVALLYRISDQLHAIQKLLENRAP